MHRLTARILLILLLVSTLVPVAMAVDGPPQHACCLRMMHSHRQNPILQAVTKPGDGNCCPSMATAHWAQVSGASGVQVAAVPQLADFKFQEFGYSALVEIFHAGRAPPVLSPLA